MRPRRVAARGGGRAAGRAPPSLWSQGTARRSKPPQTTRHFGRGSAPAGLSNTRVASGVSLGRPCAETGRACNCRCERGRAEAERGQDTAAW